MRTWSHPVRWHLRILSTHSSSTIMPYDSGWRRNPFGRILCLDLEVHGSWQGTCQLRNYLSALSCSEGNDGSHRRLHKYSKCPQACCNPLSCKLYPLEWPTIVDDECKLRRLQLCGSSCVCWWACSGRKDDIGSKIWGARCAMRFLYPTEPFHIELCAFLHPCWHEKRKMSCAIKKSLLAIDSLPVQRYAGSDTLLILFFVKPKVPPMRPYVWYMLVSVVDSCMPATRACNCSVRMKKDLMIFPRTSWATE